ncbi:MAG: hypothetical protein RIS29_2485 [Bacteroidota bacterium]|jgi:FKBP-type peptidyl-prolyl cis-trans isomerase
MKISYLISGIIIAGLVACGKQAPQLPANKFVPDNSKAETLLTINESLIQREDSLLEIYVKKSGKPFSKHELGFWYLIDKKGTGKKVIKDVDCNIRYQLSLISGEEVDNGIQTLKPGKKESTNGLEEFLQILHHGDSATVILPWYLAYGMQGSQSPPVPSYTSVIYSVEVLN